MQQPEPQLEAARKRGIPGLVLMPLAYLAWGSTFVVGKIALDYFGPEALVALRFLAAGIIVLGAVIVVRKPMCLPAGFWPITLAVGFLQYFVYYYLVYLGMRTVPAGKAAVIASSYPLMIAVGEAMLYRKRPSGRTIAGVLVGFAGVAIAMGVSPAGAFGVGKGELLVLGSALAITVASFIWNKRVAADVGLFTGSSMLVGGLCATALVPFSGRFASVSNEPRALLSLVYLILVGSIFVFLVWNRLIAHGDLVGVSTYSYTVPLIAAAMGALWLGESVTAPFVLGTIMTASSLWLVEPRPQ